MKMKKYILTAVVAGMAFAAKAQQLQTSSHYDMQGILHNPSIAGVQQSPSVKGVLGGSYRQQWSGISGSPRTLNLFGSFKLEDLKAGIGGYIYSDKTGPTSRTGIDLAFAKHIPLANDAVFSLGIDARMQQYSVDMEKLGESLGNDPLLAGNDNKFKFDAGFGISFTTPRFQIGAAVSQLIQSKLDFYEGDLNRSAEARLYRHYYLHSHYKWNVDEATTITPHILATYLPNAPFEFVGGARVEHRELFWWGVGYRIRQGWLLNAGIHVMKKFSVGYSYDIYNAPISEFNAGHSAHEVMLRFNFLK